MSAVEHAGGVVASLAVEVDPAGSGVFARMSDRQRNDAALHREVRVRGVPAERESGEVNAPQAVGGCARFERRHAVRQGGEVDAALDAKERAQTNASSAGG